MKEQIEEMWNIITTDCDNKCVGCEFENDDWCFTHRVVKALYNAGYRKQKEGEWVKATEWMRGDGEIYDYRCSSCNMLAEDGGYGNRDNLTKYCPNCGAKMKGGAD
jgi:hypothetical protein